MKYILFNLIFFTTINSWAMDCSKHKIYCHIIKNKPSISEPYAMKLSNVIYKKSKKYNINPILFSAIIAQESSYRLKAKNCTKGIYFKNSCTPHFGMGGLVTRELCDKINSKPTEVKVCTDFGLTQIHYKTAKRFNFEIEKLNTDMEYAVEAGMIVLADFKKRYAKKEFYWWTRYNSSTPTKRDIYRQLVDRYL